MGQAAWPYQHLHGSSKGAWNPGVIAWFGLEGTFKGQLVQPTCDKQGLLQLDQAWGCCATGEGAVGGERNLLCLQNKGILAKTGWKRGP